MKRQSILVVVVFLSVANIASADTFGTGSNQFTIDFVNISGDTNPTSGYGIVNNDYRMGTYEITNDQWNKFTNIYGTPTGSPSMAYDESASWTGPNAPTNKVSWYEAAQFVNWLNTSSGYSQAYKFTGTQGQSDYTFVPWDITDVGYDTSNPFRNSNAFYVLPTEDEWVKAAYWNGTSLQTYATVDDSIPVAGVDTNYDADHSWDVGSGSEELNGTFDMMGNVIEWFESPYYSGNYLSDSFRGIRGGSYYSNFGSCCLGSSFRYKYDPIFDLGFVGFRVASVNEPPTPPPPVVIDFVTISNPGNPGDTRAEANPNGCGAVGYEYQIGKYEVTNAQWNAFILAAGGPPTGSPSIAYDENAYYTGPNVPTNRVSWYEIAQFCNYLTSGDKSLGAYQLGADGSITIDRDSAISAYGTVYVIPTEDEWYKAAYYKPDGSGYSTYANGEESVPSPDNGWNYYGGAYSSPWDVGTGTEEQNGTFDMMGNLWEWNETPFSSSYYSFRGGLFAFDAPMMASSNRGGGGSPVNELEYLGFRVASIFEPSALRIYVDIKPRSCPNPLNIKSKGVLPVAILGSDDFNVNTIDIASIRLEGVAPIRSGYEDVETPVQDSNQCDCNTIGPDGYTDLTLKFKTNEIVEVIGEVDDGDLLSLILEGVLLDETPIEGTDCVLIRGKHKPFNIADMNKDGVVDLRDFAIFAENWLESSIVEE